jgi:hypothetical protein
MRPILFSLFILMMFSISCKTPVKSSSSNLSDVAKTPKAGSSQNAYQPVFQGITGTVTIITGNQMPKIGRPAPTPKAYPTTVYFYEPTNISQAVQTNNSALFSFISTKLIDSIKTDANGLFTQALPVGKYSVLVKVRNSYFANLYDVQNNINIVNVEKGKLTEHKIVVNNDAAY